MVNAMLLSNQSSAAASNAASSTPGPSASLHTHMSRVYRSELSLCLAVASVDIQPREIPMHSRPSQTDPSLLQSLVDHHVQLASRGSAADAAASNASGSHLPLTHDTDDVDDTADDGSASAVAEGSGTVEAHDQELLRRHSTVPSHEKEPLLTSSPFIGFLKRSSPVVEQAMALQDRYTLRPASLTTDLNADPAASSTSSSRSALKGARRNQPSTQSDGLDLIITLHDEQFTKDQDIYDVQFNPSDPSRILTSSFSASTGSSVLEWNLEYDGRVESRHHCPSRITSLRYWNGMEPQRTITAEGRGDAHQRLIIGGSYTGQIVLWDMKASSFRPVVTLSHSSISSSSSSGASPHQHPIYNIIPIDSHLFATADTMGLMAIWDLNKLQQPVEVISLSWTAGSSSADAATTSAAQQEVAVTSLCFRDDNTFFVTSEDGALYQGQRHGDFRGLTKSLSKGHEATITSSDLHPSPSPTRVAGRSVPVSNNLSDLMLTASADWSVALWSPRNSSSPLHRFSYFNDYVLDVAWSPVHPAMFAAADGSGCLSVWNLNQDTEVPCVVNRNVSSAINRLAWNPHITASHLMIAGAEHHGNIHIFELSNDVGKPQPDDWSKFDQVVTSFLSTNVPNSESPSSDNQ
jgi:dynein intermediate chain, cytosolic